MPPGTLLVALLTPFTPRGEVDVEALHAHVADLRAARVDGFFLCGTTGEGPLLEDNEVVLITRTVLDTCGGEMKVVTQVGRPSTRATLRLLEKTLAAGAHATTAVTPYYYEIDDAGMEAHYRELLRATGSHSFYAYVIPRRSGNDITPELARILASAGLHGIKDSTRSIERHREYQKIASEMSTPFEVYMGTDGLALEALQSGSTGIVSAIANLAPELFHRLRDHAINGRSQNAVAVRDEIHQLRASLQHGNMISNLKAGVRQRLARSGVTYPTSLRPPLGVTQP